MSVVTELYFLCYDSKNLLSHLSLPLISHDQMFIYLFRLITNPHNAIPSSSSLLPPPSSLYHQWMTPCQQTSKTSDMQCRWNHEGLKRRFTIFWAFRYFFLLSLTAENRTRCQQELRWSGVSKSAPKVFFFVSFFYFILFC